jgi:hypothetical protein
MDIGPMEPALQPVLPSEGIRRVEGRSEPRDLPRRQQSREEQPEDGEADARQDSVDVSQNYRLAHPEHSDISPEVDTPDLLEPPAAVPHLDIEA